MKLIVFAVHGCPVGGLGPYGNEWIATPNLDRLAAEGIVYDRHFADVPDAIAARRTWWANDGLFRTLPVDSPRVLIIASRLAFDAPPDMYAPFNNIVDARPDEADQTPGDALLRKLPELLDQLEHEKDWLIWIECDRLMPPWHVPQDVFEVYIEDLLEVELDEHGLPVPAVESDYAEEPLTPCSMPPVGPLPADDTATWELIQRSFATAMTSFDAELGRCLELIHVREPDQRITFMLTADFGYPLGDHGIVGPIGHPHLHEGFVHLPLIVRSPNAEDAGRRIWNFTQPTDLAAVLLGEPLIRTEVVSTLTQDEATEWAIRTDAFALLLPIAQHPDDPRMPMLYVKPDDRWEANDVSTQHPEVLEELETKLRKSIVV